MQTIGRGARSLVDLLFPPVCHCCGGWDELTAGPFCAQCGDHINAERHEEACPTCAASVAPFEVSGGRSLLTHSLELSRSWIHSWGLLGPDGPPHRKRERGFQIQWKAEAKALVQGELRRPVGTADVVLISGVNSRVPGPRGRHTRPLHGMQTICGDGGLGKAGYGPLGPFVSMSRPLLDANNHKSQKKYPPPPSHGGHSNTDFSFVPMVCRPGNANSVIELFN